MSEYTNEIGRMKYLMNYGKDTINESENRIEGGAIEYTTAGPDNKIYGIVRENSRYYIKIAEPGKEKLTENFDYIGGFCNRKANEYHSYPLALKQLELKMMSLNEAYEGKARTEMLDPMAKEAIKLNESIEMSGELKRHRQILENVSRISLGEAIDSSNIGDPEKPKGNGKEGTDAPFKEKAEAKLDKDMKETAKEPAAQSEPFKEKAPRKPDMKESKKSSSKKLKEGCECCKEEWGSCGLPSDAAAGTAEIGDSAPFEKKNVKCGMCEEENPEAETSDNGSIVAENKKARRPERVFELVREEKTVLHDFGRHPGYRKKVMTLPTDAHAEKPGYHDWNHDSVKGEHPFGQQIGSNAPFDKLVSIITDSIVSELQESRKKKSSR